MGTQTDEQGDHFPALQNKHTTKAASGASAEQLPVLRKAECTDLGHGLLLHHILSSGSHGPCQTSGSHPP